ncbi:DMT family transporter [Anaerocolumna aminovalerica]|uniref:DMT family transporter n=1 Tax=Anaerocolumna aminovalerica TaxID=1527 RepID=UPI000BE47CB7|nr:DMT family transporter [Anaerocolumna aminovalerica]
MKNSNSTKAYLAAILYALIIGLSFLFTKIALTVTNPMNILAHRFTISFIAASIPVLLGWIKLNIRGKDILSILPLALFYPALFFAFQAFGLVYISSSEAGIIQATVPVFTMILAAVFLKESMSFLQMISLMLSVCGVIYIFLMKGIDLKSASFTGIILIILSALSSACYSVITRKVSKKYRLMDLTYIMIVIGFLSFNTISLADYIIKGTLVNYFKPFTEPLFLISILYLGILSSLITSLLTNYALSKMDATKMSVFSNLSTLITMLAGVIFLHEELKTYHIFGAIMIIIGVIGTNFFGKKNNYQ